MEHHERLNHSISGDVCSAFLVRLSSRLEWTSRRSASHKQRAIEGTEKNVTTGIEQMIQKLVRILLHIVVERV